MVKFISFQAKLDSVFVYIAINTKIIKIYNKVIVCDLAVSGSSMAAELQGRTVCGGRTLGDNGLIQKLMALHIRRMNQRADTNIHIISTKKYLKRVHFNILLKTSYRKLSICFPNMPTHTTI